MGTPDVLARLQALGLRLTRQGDAIRAAPRSALSDETRGLIRAHKAELLQALPELVDRPQGIAREPLEDLHAEAHRQRVIGMLAERPDTKYAVLTDDQADPEGVILVIAIRGVVTCELRIPRQKYDPFLLLDLIRRHGGTMH